MTKREFDARYRGNYGERMSRDERERYQWHLGRGLNAQRRDKLADRARDMERTNVLRLPDAPLATLATGSRFRTYAERARAGDARFSRL